ncbi:hypothetical protein [Staphylococcus canis]|uniref:HlyD family efflux transporter periplasmic adaptor subunit n=1 Tax=Staphylococcus canis TaxID=2724942 RepID=A0ABS0T8T9_9STAP|nr:hypothetical protein [Staphylococcus canis]MBI5975121.1 hypothetical protein [Staphylococcus canis]
MFKKSTLLFPLLFFLVLCCLASYYFIRNNTPHYDTIQAQLSKPKTIKGLVQADQHYMLSLDSNSRLNFKIHVEDTTSVKKGTPLISYYDPNIFHQMTRLKRLAKSNLPPEQSFQLALKLIELRSQLYTTIKSPFSGIVHLHKNYAIQNDKPILDVLSKTQHITTRLPEHLHSYFSKNKKVIMKNKSTNQFVEGTVHSIDILPITPYSPTKISTYIMTIKTPKSYTLGTHFDIEIEPAQIILPKDVLLDKYTVVLYKKHKYIKRRVNYDKLNDKIIIKKGIFVGESVVRNPNVNMF